jgi:hypothetical protein
MDICCPTKRKNTMKTGIQTTVNMISMENTSGNGLFGKSYSPFPTKKRSMYVAARQPNSTADK